MKKYLLLLLTAVILFSGCSEKENDDDLTQDATEKIVASTNDYTDVQNGDTEEDLESTGYDDIDHYPETYEFDPNESSGVIYAKFRSASFTEGEIALHFNVAESQSHVSFYFYDIDPEKEGLYTYKETEGSTFPELLTNPEIENYLLTLHWKKENRETGVEDVFEECPVLKKIEKEDISDVYD